jgi:hypothetical protein
LSAEWDVPSEKLKALAAAATAPDPEVRPLTKAEKDRIVGGHTAVARDMFMAIPEVRD